jgi:predicted alpha/beta-hydrolase family hydrolase
MKKWLKIILVTGLIVVLAAAGRFVYWGLHPAPAQPAALAALQSDAAVTVTDEPWGAEFAPAGQAAESGFIIYPGAHVDWRAYSLAAREIAACGYQVDLVMMPLSMALFAPGRAEQVIVANPSIQNWIIGGHSLGGVEAAAYAYDHPSQIQGLVFWASYPAEANDFSASSLPVLSISGSLDGLATPEKIGASAQRLPSSTLWLEIQGGNHAQFGDYGSQSGDNPAAISAEDQREQIVAATCDFISAITAAGK